MSPNDTPNSVDASAKGFKSLKTSYKTALVIAVLAAVWMASGVLTGPDEPAPAPPPVAGDGAASAATNTMPRVRVKTLHSQRHAPSISLMGMTRAGQAVQVRTEIPGRVAAVVAEKGQPVAKGDVLVRLDGEDRTQRLSEARARLKQRQIASESAQKLSQGGYSSQLNVAQAEADLAAAHAQVTRMERELANTDITAPFAGVVDTLPLEAGDYLDRAGQVVARVLDLSTIKAVGHVTERDVAHIDNGGDARIILPDGREITGRVTYVSQASQSATRTFPVEVTAEVPGRDVPEGLTADIRLPMTPITGHKVSPALLTLDDQGRIGVKVVDADDVVRFHAVALATDGLSGAWLTGLPDEIRVITVGQEYVRVGTKVRAVEGDLPTMQPDIAGGEAPLDAATED